MFHREVTEGENIITQGDDGDNFYVIERHVHDKSVQVSTYCSNGMMMGYHLNLALDDV